MDATHDYFLNIQTLLSTIEAMEMEKIHRVADFMSQSFLKGGITHVFGAGHSRIPAKEIFIRAGTLSCIRAMGVNDDLDRFERLEGLAGLFLQDYDLRPDEVLIVISNSGINPLPIEVAMIGNKLGLHTVAITSLEHSRKVGSRHSSKKHLFEVAEISIDTHVPAGDASIEVSSLPMKIGPLSTLAGVTIVNAIVVETINQILTKGSTPPVRISRNLPGGDDHNRKFKEQFGSRIPEL